MVECGFEAAVDMQIQMKVEIITEGPHNGLILHQSVKPSTDGDCNINLMPKLINDWKSHACTYGMETPTNRMDPSRMISWHEHPMKINKKQFKKRKNIVTESEASTQLPIAETQLPIEWTESETSQTESIPTPHSKLPLITTKTWQQDQNSAPFIMPEHVCLNVFEEEASNILRIESEKMPIIQHPVDTSYEEQREFQFNSNPKNDGGIVPVQTLTDTVTTTTTLEVFRTIFDPMNPPNYLFLPFPPFSESDKKCKHILQSNGPSHEIYTKTTETLISDPMHTAEQRKQHIKCENNQKPLKETVIDDPGIILTETQIIKTNNLNYNAASLDSKMFTQDSGDNTAESKNVKSKHMTLSPTAITNFPSELSNISLEIPSVHVVEVNDLPEDISQFIPENQATVNEEIIDHCEINLSSTEKTNNKQARLQNTFGAHYSPSYDKRLNRDKNEKINSRSCGDRHVHNGKWLLGTETNVNESEKNVIRKCSDDDTDKSATSGVDGQGIAFVDEICQSEDSLMSSLPKDRSHPVYLESNLQDHTVEFDSTPTTFQSGNNHSSNTSLCSMGNAQTSTDTVRYAQLMHRPSPKSINNSSEQSGNETVSQLTQRMCKILEHEEESLRVHKLMTNTAV